MTPDRSHLVPEQRTDRNGKTSTRWVKQSSEDALKSLGIAPPPPPALTYTQGLAASRIKIIDRFTQTPRSTSLTERWITGMSKRELAVLDSALEVCESTSLDRTVVREQEVIKSIFHSLAMGRGAADEDRLVLEMLTLRAAFCSDWSQLETPTTRNAELKSYFYGLRNNADLPLDTDRLVTGLTATIRFAYEMTARFPNADFLPTFKTETNAILSSIKVGSRTYVTPELANLVFQYPEDTDYLIALAAEYRTNDAQILRGLYENTDGAESLAQGWL